MEFIVMHFWQNYHSLDNVALRQHTELVYIKYLFQIFFSAHGFLNAK